MTTIIVCNILLILCVTALCGFFGKEESRWWWAWAGFCFAGGMSINCWLIFVIIHFAAKYW